MIRKNSNSPSELVDGKSLPQTDTITYLGSTVRVDSGAPTGIKQRLSRAAFNNLQSVWKSGQNTIRITLKLYNSSVIPICCMVQNAGD